MNKEQKQVRLEMLKAGQSCPSVPTIPSKEVKLLRLDLHYEEAIKEFREAILTEDLVNIADSLGDSLVVIYGSACACGIDMEPIMTEIHKSNMSKFIGGVLKSPNGKYLKGPHYKSPDISTIINLQLTKKVSS